MTEKLSPEKAHQEAQKMALKYLKSGTDLVESTGLRDLLGLSDDLGPLLFSTCAQKLIEYDMTEKIEELERKANGNAPVPELNTSPHAKIVRKISLLGMAAGVLEQSDQLYINGTFFNGAPPQIPIISDAIHDLFTMLAYQATTPTQTLTTRERVENWGASWRTRLNPNSTLEA
ncbi:MAG: hypothetical protein KA477_01460 [Candidatus Levybacteria bacterium]|nr:hypothetical protein [Candidatus Levybacteria bacterium]